MIQAAIAALHADEPRDWPQIAALYGELAELTRSPVVELNRAVAVAEAVGPEAALEIVDRLELTEYRYFHATRGELLRRLGRPGRSPRGAPACPGPGRRPARARGCWSADLRSSAPVKRLAADARRRLPERRARGRRPARARPGRGQVRLEVLRCGICGSDLHARHGLDDWADMAAKAGYDRFGRSDRAGRVRPRVLRRRWPSTGRRRAPSVPTGTPVVALPLLRARPAASTPSACRCTRPAPTPSSCSSRSR